MHFDHILSGYKASGVKEALGTVLKTIKCDSTFTLQRGTWNHLRLRKEMFSVFDVLFAEILDMFREVTINTLRAGGLMLLVVALLAVLRNINHV